MLRVMSCVVPSCLMVGVVGDRSLMTYHPAPMISKRIIPSCR